MDLKNDVARGRLVFRKTCAVCHRLEDHGVEVGPICCRPCATRRRRLCWSIFSIRAGRSILRYIDYLVTLQNGRQVTGLIAAETAASVTVRRAEKVEETLLRNQIDTIQATAKSLMPEGLEMQLNRQEVADVIAYLQAQAAPK